MDAKILITHHKQSHVISSNFLCPIQVGDGPDLPGITWRDNTGDNISRKNDRYCEMTAAYWAWKNLGSADYIGLMHYRRLFDFNETHLPLDTWGAINWPAFTTDMGSTLGLNDDTIAAAIVGYDMIVPRKWSVHNAGFSNLRTHYAHSPFHHHSDLVLCRDYIAKYHPEYLEAWRSVFSGDAGYFTNMFIFRTEIFDQYCRWLFPLLESVEQQIPFDRYGKEETRVLGFLAERLLNVWVTRYQETHPSTRVHELDRVFVQDTTPKVWDPESVSSSNSLISVVIASDDHYVPHLGALIVSIFDNLHQHAQVDLLILDGGISVRNRELLTRLVPLGSSVSFIPMSDEFRSYFTHMHFSRATFYRLILDGILKSRTKVIYIDCDTIVLGDIAELWDYDLAGFPIGAVHDYIMEHFCKSNVLSADFTGSLPARRYLEEYVGIDKSVSSRYFQAGVLVMDLAKLRQLNLSARMTDALLSRRYWFLDQDVLNKYFCGAHMSLPPEWNFVNCKQDITFSLDRHSVLELEQAAQNIKLIHYAGYEAKPWVTPSTYLGEYYFYYLRQTFWYEQVVGTFGRDQGNQGNQGDQLIIPSSAPPSGMRRLLKRIWRTFPWYLRRPFVPVLGYLRERWS